MKGLIETPGLPKADCRRGLARLYLLSVLYLSYSCLLMGGAAGKQDNPCRDI